MKLQINLNGGWINLQPLGLNKLTSSWDQEEGKGYYNRKMSGSLTFTGAEYQLLYNYENSGDRCVAIPARIMDGCAVEAALFTGELHMGDGEWWPDNCQLKISLKEIENEAALIAKWDQEQNILGFGSGSTVKAVTGTYETVICEDDFAGSTTQATTALYWCQAGSPADGKWKPTKAYSDNLKQNDLWRVKTIWIREVITVDSSITLTAPWTLLSSTATTKNYVREAQLGSEVTDALDGQHLYRTWALIGGNTSSFDNGRKMMELISYLANEYAGLTVQSNFFNYGITTPLATNPINGRLDCYRHIHLFQKSDIVRHDASQNATVANLTLEKLINALEIMFNVKFAVSAGKLILEHESWFTEVNGMDLTTAEFEKYLAGKHKYRYDKDKLYKQEIFKCKEAKYPDFVGAPIEYTGACLNNDSKNNKKEYATDLIITDVAMCIDQEDKESNLDGIVMIAAELVNGNYCMAVDPGILGEPKPNNVLSWAHLHKDFHKWSRVLPTGKMNKQLTIFNSSKRAKLGERITIPYCWCNGAFEPNKLVKTMMGWGKVVSADYKLETETLELNLAYHASSNGSLPNVPPVSANDTANVAYNSSVQINALNNDFDLDGTLDPTSVVITSAPGYGTITGTTAAGLINYQAPAGWWGSTSFRYTVADNDGAVSAEATVFVTVAAPVTAPNAVNDIYTMLSYRDVLVVDAANGVLANDTNWQGVGTFSIISYTQPTGGSAPANVTLNADGSFDFGTQDRGAPAGTWTFTYTIQNQNNQTDTATVTITKP